MVSKYRLRLFWAGTSVIVAVVCLFSLPSRHPSVAHTLDIGIRSDDIRSAIRPPKEIGVRSSAYFGNEAAPENDYVYKSILDSVRKDLIPSGDRRVGRSLYRSVVDGNNVSKPAEIPTARTVVRGRAPVTGNVKVVSLVNSRAVELTNDELQQLRQTAPDVVQMVGPVSLDLDLRDLPYISPMLESKNEVPLRRHPFNPNAKPDIFDPIIIDPDAPEAPSAMPTPLQTFAGVTQAQSGCGCLPPDTDGDVGPNDYMQSVNSSIRIFDKTGVSLAGPTTYNSFFSALGPSTPCGNGRNDGDGIVFYDQIADRWLVSDFAFPAFPGTSFYQCIGVSKTSDPVSGGFWLYAVQTDATNTSYLGDYPKFGLWPDGYYFTVNLFSNNTTFNGVRVFALDRNAMIGGGAANAVTFTILPADLGDQYSLVPASFRAGSAPPAGQPEWLMDINSSTTAGTVENKIFVRRFHVDFATPANSTFGVGASHVPDGTVTVNGFVDAFSASI